MAMVNIGLEPENMSKPSRAAYDYMTNIPSEFDFPQVCSIIIMCDGSIKCSVYRPQLSNISNSCIFVRLKNGNVSFTVLYLPRLTFKNMHFALLICTT